MKNIDELYEALEEPVEPTPENLSIIAEYLNAHDWKPICKTIKQQ